MAVNEVFGEVDAMKLRLSLTMVSLAGGGAIFEAAVTRWFGTDGEKTRELVGTSMPGEVSSSNTG